MSDNIHSVLLVHAGALGDFMLSLSVLQALRARRPRSVCRALCRCRVAAHFVEHGILTGWDHLESTDFLPLFSDEVPPAPSLKEYLDRFDLIISMLGDRSTISARRLGEIARGRLVCVDPEVRRKTLVNGRHIVDQWMDDLSEQDVKLERERIVQPLRVQKSSRPTVLLHPGSGSLSKCWPLAKFEELANRLLHQDFDAQFLIGPVEFELSHGDLKHRLERTAPVVYEENLCTVAKKLLDASLYVGNDAGMTHVAAALGVRTLVLFIATSADTWQPIGQHVQALKDPSVDQVERSVKQWIDHLAYSGNQ